MQRACWRRPNDRGLVRERADGLIGEVVVAEAVLDHQGRRLEGADIASSRLKLVRIRVRVGQDRRQRYALAAQLLDDVVVKVFHSQDGDRRGWAWFIGVRGRLRSPRAAACAHTTRAR